MKQDLEALQSYVNEMKATSSGNDKKEIIKKYSTNEFVTKCMVYENSPYIMFGVTSKVILKHPELASPSKAPGTELFYILDMLSNRTITGHSAIMVVNGFINDNPTYKELILSLIDKDLKTRAGASLINKVIPNLIPTFDVALATKHEPEMCDFENEDWYASRKLDGVRCIIKVDDLGYAKGYSRSGKEFLTIGNVLRDVESLGLRNMILDGELCIVDENGDEDFTSIIKLIHKKDFTIPNPKFIVFDSVTESEFNNQESITTLSERRRLLFESCHINHNNLDTIDVLEMELIKSQKDFDRWQDVAKENNWEGFMVRKDVGYKGKRSKELLKVKKFHDDEYKVLGTENGPFRIIVEGQEEEEEVMTNVLIEHKGNRVSVGSGFSLEERRKYFKNPELIVGKEITVQYFEETTNQQGTTSLRFPTVKVIYENGRNI